MSLSVTAARLLLEKAERDGLGDMPFRVETPTGFCYPVRLETVRKVSYCKRDFDRYATVSKRSTVTFKTD